MIVFTINQSADKETHLCSLVEDKTRSLNELMNESHSKTNSFLKGENSDSMSMCLKYLKQQSMPGFKVIL